MFGKSVFLSVATTAAVGVSLPSSRDSGRMYGLMPWGRAEQGGEGRHTGKAGRTTQTASCMMAVL